MPDKNNKLSPGKKNPANNPVSAKTINKTINNPNWCPAIFMVM
jgi:hypothetical protein